jgi:hypothetical protein
VRSSAVALPDHQRSVVRHRRDEACEFRGHHEAALRLLRRAQGSHEKDSPTEAALYWRFKPAVLPACRFHRITYQHFVEVIAPRTFKGPQIGVGGTKFDAGQLHVALALGATWPFDGKQRRFGTSMRFRHVMHP